MEQYCIGVDFGTDSVRSIVVDVRDGREVAAAVFTYPRWRDGLYCNAEINQFRQHPLDHIEGLEATIRQCLAVAGPVVSGRVRAISIDTTGSTPAPVDEFGAPLALHPSFAEDPDAMFILWKDHTAAREASEINAHAKKFEVDYLRYVGGVYSSEWFWSKLLHVVRKNARVREACHSWVEHCDWLPFLLTGGRHVAEMKRSVCTAGHKALWSEDWGGLPPVEFFASLDPLLSGFGGVRYRQTYTADQQAGHLCGEWAERLGLSVDVVVGIGAMDAHMGAVGGQIEPYYLSKVMGTSTCDMLVAPLEEMEGKFIPGICGLVNGSIIPGMVGMEAGQSAFGDVYAWFRDLVSWPLRHLGIGEDMAGRANGGEELIEKLIDRIIPELSRRAMALSVEDRNEISVDWFNGRRTPDANPFVKGGIMGLSLGSDAPRVFHSLVESTCFGARAIVEQFTGQGVPVKGLIGIGGIAQKSPYIMQMLADVFNMPIKINRSEQTCAMGAAMFAATVAGVYEKVEQAMQAMGQGFGTEYQPDKKKASVYDRRYGKYRAVGDFIEHMPL
ncbi:MAG TPA: ribulokinase [Puia sp.]|nr:ribulokinase [Puia sp.]